MFAQKLFITRSRLWRWKSDLLSWLKFLKSSRPFSMSKIGITSRLRNGVFFSLQPKNVTTEIHPRCFSHEQKRKSSKAREVTEFSADQLVRPDFSLQNKWFAPKRTLFYVPGSSQKMIDKAWSLEVDNIVGPFWTLGQLKLIVRHWTSKILCTRQKRPGLAVW